MVTKTQETPAVVERKAVLPLQLKQIANLLNAKVEFRPIWAESETSRFVCAVFLRETLHKSIDSRAIVGIDSRRSSAILCIEQEKRKLAYILKERTNPFLARTRTSKVEYVREQQQLIWLGAKAVGLERDQYEHRDDKSIVTIITPVHVYIPSSSSQSLVIR
jgi:hypothetical protein